jgi:hypothetical protein
MHQPVDDEAELRAAALAAVSLLLEESAAAVPTAPAGSRWRAAMRLSPSGPLSLQRAERAGWQTIERLRRAAAAERGNGGR